jgi:hypothetical protein
MSILAALKRFFEIYRTRVLKKKIVGVLVDKTKAYRLIRLMTPPLDSAFEATFTSL